MSLTPLWNKQGDTLRVDFKVQTPAGAAQSLTGCTCTFAMAPITARTSPTVSKSATITDATNGLCSIVLDGADTAAAGTFYYELEVRYPTGETVTHADGTLSIDPTIRPTT